MALGDKSYTVWKQCIEKEKRNSPRHSERGLYSQIGQKRKISSCKSCQLACMAVCLGMWQVMSWPDPEGSFCYAEKFEFSIWVIIQSWKRSIFIPIPKKGDAKECSRYCTIALISHASKVILQILQARLQQYVNHELSDVQAGFRKGRGTRDQIANIVWIIEKAREFQKNIYLHYWLCQSLWLCGSQ